MQNYNSCFLQIFSTFFFRSNDTPDSGTFSPPPPPPPPPPGVPAPPPVPQLPVPALSDLPEPKSEEREEPVQLVERFEPRTPEAANKNVICPRTCSINNPATIKVC